ncbi:hypothetical protein [Arthrobacter sp. SLBN-122]|nr:hypothetical protein [Arthrobacter sp. SLBN-122]
MRLPQLPAGSMFNHWKVLLEEELGTISFSSADAAAQSRALGAASAG